jgi:large subunit ribosomal protein L5
MGYQSTIEKEYNERIVPAIRKRFNYKSVMQVPVLKKIIVNRGVGKATSDKKLIEDAVNEFSLITGQKPVVTKAKKDISNFKLRKGMPIGCCVTLRNDRMYEFLERLVNVALPRVRDFKGIPNNGFDGRGNYTLGVKEQIIFMEIDVDKITNISGMDVTFVTSAKTDEEAFELLKEFGLPFRNQNKQS